MLAPVRVRVPAPALAREPVPELQTQSLSISFRDTGPRNSKAALLLYGWPDDCSTWDGVAEKLNWGGIRTIMPNLRGFGDIVDVSPVVASLVGTIGWIVPSFSAFDVKAQVVHGIVLPSGFVWMTLVYAACYIAALLVASIAIFSRREFK